MTKHQKRLSVPKSWPVERKTETFTAKADAGPHGESGVPLVVVLRDVLEYVNSKKEANYAIDTAGVLVNGDTVNDVNRPIGMFDILSFPDRDEYYRVFPDEGGRLGLTPIAADAADSKLGKIEDKTLVSGGQVQLNLHDGQNLLVEEDDYSGSDSVVVDNETMDVVAHFVLEEGALVTAVRGQHAGEIGEVADIQVTPGSADNTIVVDTDDGSFETVEEYIVVIDENFVGGSADAASDAAVDETEPVDETEDDAAAVEDAESDESESVDADQGGDEE